MQSQTPKPAPPRQKLIVYVDGFNLYYGMHQRLGRSTLWLDLVELASSFRPKQELVAVRYFTAPVLGDPAAQGRQDHYIRALQALYPRQFEAIPGRYQNRKIKCYNCQHVRDHYEEKETDVNIAVRLLTDAALHNMDTAILVSGDSDMVPAVKAAMKIRPTLFVAAAFPPDRVSKDLATLVPASFSIGIGKLKKFQMPQTFVAGGNTYTRPTKWN